MKGRQRSTTHTGLRGSGHSDLPVKARGRGLLIFVAFQGKGWDSDIKVGAIRPLKSKSAPAKIMAEITLRPGTKTPRKHQQEGKT